MPKLHQIVTVDLKESVCVEREKEKELTKNNKTLAYISEVSSGFTYSDVKTIVRFCLRISEQCRNSTSFGTIPVLLI